MRYLALFCLLALIGCNAKEPTAKVDISLVEVPTELVDIAKKTLPDVTFDSARKIKVKGEDAFEIRGKQPNGKVREVEISASGTVIEVE